MDFSWTIDEIQAYKTASEYANKNLLLLQIDKSFAKQFPLDQWNLLGNFGALSLSVPKQYGGQGLNALQTARIIEALALGGTDMGLLFSACAHLLACNMPIVDFGSEKLKQELLPSLCSGKYIGANAITEEQAGSDVYAIKTSAEKKDDHYILNGTKSFVTNGPIADILTVYAITNPNYGYLGISGFVVKANTPGVELDKAFSKMGLNSAQAGWVKFNNCTVSANNMLGNEGDGANIFHKSMMWERSCLFAAYVGLMDRQLKSTINHVRQRKQFGKAISKQQAVAHRIADMKLRLESARLMLYQACWYLDNSENPTMEVALSKLAISEAAIQSSLDAIQLHGAYGYTLDNDIEQMLRDSLPATIFSGSSEMQRNLIASELGL